MLEDKIRAKLAKKNLLLMPHLVLGGPSFAENEKVIAAMVGAGADIIEMQVPFSDPMSDGPVIMKANDAALRAGADTDKALVFAKKMTAAFKDAAFVFMTYYNILFAYGVERFVEAAAGAGVEGLIVPDLPPEEAEAYLVCCDRVGVSPIFILTPTNSDARLELLAKTSRGMVYCVGRKGVTGIKTSMDRSILDLIARYRAKTTLPLAFGFGIQSKEDVDFIRGKVDIAVIGTQLLELYSAGGAAAVGAFLKSLN